MKAVHVVRQFAPSVGGLESAVLNLCGALASRGVDARVVTLDRIANEPGLGRLAPDDSIQGIRVNRIPFAGSWRYPVAPAVLGQIAEADVVHVHGIDFFFDYLALTRPLHGKTLVASTHGGFFHTRFARRLKQAYFHTVTRAAVRAYHAICASSESDHALFRPVAGRRLVLAPNGVDTAKWRDRGSPDAVRRLIYIGRFSANKNLAALFPVLQALRARDPAWSLVLAGRPWDVTSDALRHEAERCGVTDAVTILDNPSDAMIGEAIASASYVVSPSHHEGFGLSIVEGLSAGLVPVLSRIPPFASLVADTGCGLLVDFDAPTETARAVEALHGTLVADPRPIRASALAAAGRFSWDAAAEAVLRCYQSAPRRQGGSTQTHSMSSR